MSSLFCIKYASSLEAAVRPAFHKQPMGQLCGLSLESGGEASCASPSLQTPEEHAGEGSPALLLPAQLWPEEWEQSVECPSQSWPIKRSSAHPCLLSSPAGFSADNLRWPLQPSVEPAKVPTDGMHEAKYPWLLHKQEIKITFRTSHRIFNTYLLLQ